MDGERYLQASSTPAIAGSKNVAVGSLVQDVGLNIKEEPADTDLDAGPAAPQHVDMDPHCIGSETKANFTEEEPGLADDVKSEPALLVKEEVVEVGWQDIAEQQCFQGPSTSAIVGSTNVLDSVADPGNTLNIKEELGAIDIGPTVIQPVDTQGTTKQKDMSVVKQERTINHHNLNPILCGGVKEEIIEDEWRADTDAQSSNKASQSEQRAPSQSYSCDKCGKTYASKQTLMAHYTNLHSTQCHKCTKCKKKFPSKHYLYIHTKRVHSEKQYECAVCKKIYGSKLALNSHVYRVHRPLPAGSEPRIHICDYCQKTFTIKGSLGVHITQVHANRSYKCSQCNMRFKCEQYLIGHTRRNHPAADTDAQCSNEGSQSKQRAPSQLYSCDKCGKIYAYKQSLMAHYTNLHSTESHKCTKCKKKFASKAYLYQHTSSVHSEQQYECAVCKKIYRSRLALNSHVYRVHRPRPAGSGPRIYICDYCQTTFKIRANFTNHITNVHTRGSYNCSQCNKSFKCERYLMRHVARVHTAGSHQLYTCTNCGKNYKYKWQCKRHEKRGICTRPTASSTSTVASTSRQQPNVVIVKEEPADGEVELGPTVFQHMDCNYRPYKQEPGLD